MQSPGTEAQGACQPIHRPRAPAHSGHLLPIPSSLLPVLLSVEPGQSKSPEAEPSKQPHLHKHTPDITFLQSSDDLLRGAAYLLPLDMSPCPHCLTFPYCLSSWSWTRWAPRARLGEMTMSSGTFPCSVVSPGGASSRAVRVVDGPQPHVPGGTA